MARKLLIAFAVLGVLLGILGVVVHRQPDEFTVRRTATVAAPPEKVFALVNDFRAWPTWSSWTDLDPGAKVTVSDPPAGEGASVSWSGNDQVGEGRMTIRQSRPPQLIDLEQTFVRPLPGTARMVFTFAPVDDATRVTWRLDGTNSFIGKALCLFMDLDATVGKSFEKDLTRLKSKAEEGDDAPASPAPGAGAR